MNFASDNAYGVMPEILRALADANVGAAPSYGDDEITNRVERNLAGIFERELVVFPVVTGTAANALGLATICPPHGAIFCHAESHIATDECGAPEFFTHGGKLVLIEGEHGKVMPGAISEALPYFQRGVHSSKPSAVSITQLTELGTVYTRAEVAALADCAHANDMRLHMDGARFANALVHRIAIWWSAVASAHGNSELHRSRLLIVTVVGETRRLRSLTVVSDKGVATGKSRKDLLPKDFADDGGNLFPSPCAFQAFG